MASGLAYMFGIVAVLWLSISTVLAISLRMTERSVRAVPAAARLAAQDILGWVAHPRRHLR